MIDELAQAANKDSLRVEGSSPSPQRLGRLDRRRVSMPQKFQFLFQGRLRLRRCRIKPTLLAVIISLGRNIPRAKRRVTNWAEYDAALRQRGSLTVWFSASEPNLTTIGMHSLSPGPFPCNTLPRVKQNLLMD